MNHQVAIGGRVDIQLYPVGAELLRQPEGAGGVFVGDAACAPMRNGRRAAELLLNFQWAIFN